MSLKPCHVHLTDATCQVFIPPTPPASRASTSSWGSEPPPTPCTPFIKPVPLPCIADMPRAPLKPIPSARTSAPTPPPIHPFLSASPHGRRATLWWDMTQPPETALLLGADAKWHAPARAQLRAAATHPPRAALTLRVRGCPWAVAVRAGQTAHVTLLDVLVDVHRTLRKGVRADERRAGPGTLRKGVRADERRAGPGALRACVERAFAARIGAIADVRAREAERSKGVRRVDYLLGKDTFGGLRLERDSSCGKDEGGVWVLDTRAGTSWQP